MTGEWHGALIMGVSGLFTVWTLAILLLGTTFSRRAEHAVATASGIFRDLVLGPSWWLYDQYERCIKDPYRRHRGRGRPG